MFRPRIFSSYENLKEVWKPLISLFGPLKLWAILALWPLFSHIYIYISTHPWCLLIVWIFNYEVCHGGNICWKSIRLEAFLQLAQPLIVQIPWGREKFGSLLYILQQAQRNCWNSEAAACRGDKSLKHTLYALHHSIGSLQHCLYIVWIVAQQ